MSLVSIREIDMDFAPLSYCMCLRGLNGEMANFKANQSCGFLHMTDRHQLIGASKRNTFTAKCGAFGNMSAAWVLDF